MFLDFGLFQTAKPTACARIHVLVGTIRAATGLARHRHARRWHRRPASACAHRHRHRNRHRHRRRRTSPRRASNRHRHSASARTHASTRRQVARRHHALLLGSTSTRIDRDDDVGLALGATAGLLRNPATSRAGAARVVAFHHLAALLKAKGTAQFTKITRQAAGAGAAFTSLIGAAQAQALKEAALRLFIAALHHVAQNSAHRNFFKLTLPAGSISLRCRSLRCRARARRRSRCCHFFSV